MSCYWLLQFLKHLFVFVVENLPDLVDSLLLTNLIHALFYIHHPSFLSCVFTFSSLLISSMKNNFSVVPYIYHPHLQNTKSLDIFESHIPLVILFFQHSFRRVPQNESSLRVTLTYVIQRMIHVKFWKYTYLFGFTLELGFLRAVFACCLLYYIVNGIF